MAPDTTIWLDLPLGRFAMGADVEPDPHGEGPLRHVTVGAFAAMARPVSVAAFAAFVDASGYRTTAEVEGAGFISDGDDPQLADGLTWHTAAQSDEQPVTQISWFDAIAFAEWSDAYLATEAEWEYLASLGHVRTQHGLYEWTNDWFDRDFHRDEQRVNPTGPPSGTHRVVHQGPPARPSKRRGRYPDFSCDDLTFRLVRR